MGAELVSSDSHSLNKKKYTEMFKEACPFYLAIGMTYEQFWYGEADLVIYYRRAHALKKKQKNEELWLQGAYFYSALCRVAPILQPFAKKGTTAQPYLKEPIPLTKKEQEEAQERERIAKVKKMKSMFQSWADKLEISSGGEVGKDAND